MNIKFILLLLILFPIAISSKVMIIVPVYNCPTFIKFQYLAFKKFLKDDFEMIIFNDASNEEMRQQIENMCQSFNIHCIRMPQELHAIPYLQSAPYPVNGASARNCNVVQYALDTIGFKHNDIVMLCDADLFLIQPFSAKEYLNGFTLAGFNKGIEHKFCRENNINWFWIGLILIDMQNLPNKDAFKIGCSRIGRAWLDSGGQTYYYLKNNPKVLVRYFDRIKLDNFFCGVCSKEKSYRCNHNTEKLNQFFDLTTIQFIQQIPIDWGSIVVSPNKKNKAHVRRRNSEFLLNRKFVHFYGSSAYSATNFFDPNKFYKDKIAAFEDYITIITR